MMTRPAQQAPMGRTGPSGTRAWSIEPVWRATEDRDATGRGGTLPEPLARRYDAQLVIPLRDDRPTVITNFVSTIDGVVAFDPGGPGGGRAVSGGSEPDRFLMGLLRATADVVLVGAGTVRASHGRHWTPGQVHPPSADAFAAWRATLGLTPQPTAVLVTGSGVLDPDGPWHALGDQPTVVMTTRRGAARLRAEGTPDVEVLGSDDDTRIRMAEVIERLAARGCRVVLCEAGPTVLGELVAEGLVDELFLTLAPRIAGREASAPRPGLVDGVAFTPSAAPTGRLRSVMRAEDHLFLRYAFDRAAPGQGGSA